MNQPIKTLTSFLIVMSMVLMPYFSAVEVANAQAANIQGYISGLAPAIAQLPLCKGKISGAVKGLFKKGVKQSKDYDQQDFGNGDGSSDGLSGKSSSAGAQAQSVSVFDQTTYNEAQKARIAAEATQKNVKSLDENDTCLKSIGRMVIKMLLQKLTVSTVAWINSGFDGNPAFIQDPGQFFGDIAKNELLAFGGEINNPSLYPFGVAFLRQTADAFNTKFQQNAQYSLNQLIASTTPQYSVQTFQANFSAGGWNAWNYMTQVPANNPLGFQLIASTELQKRLEGTYQSPANKVRDALQQAGGFLGDQRCVNPKDLTRDQHNAGVAERASSPTGPYRYEICTGGWQYVTPGKLIADKATTAINYPDNQYLKAEDLNDAIAAILDALMAKFSSDLMELGFSEFDNRGSDGAFYYDSASFADYRTQVERDFPSHMQTRWLEQNADFDIRTDLTQAIIDEQRIYRDKLIEQNKILADLNRTIYQLDYCIPGPHPGWEEDSQRSLDAVGGQIPSKTAEEIRSSKGRNTAMGIVGSIPVLGGIINSIITAAGPTDGEIQARYYAGMLEGLTGLKFSANDAGQKTGLTTKHDLINVISSLYYEYERLMYKYYFTTPSWLPEVTSDSNQMFQKAIGYEKLIEKNEEIIPNMNGVITRLTNIKDAVDILNGQLAAGQVTNQAGTVVPQAEQITQYEENLKPMISSLGRLSEVMVTGDDIAKADNLNKQAIDEIKYVYEDLIIGPYGCERHLINLRDGWKWIPYGGGGYWEYDTTSDSFTSFGDNPNLEPRATQIQEASTYSASGPGHSPSRILSGSFRAKYPEDKKYWYDYSLFKEGDTLPVPITGGSTGQGLRPYIDSSITAGNQMAKFASKSRDCVDGVDNDGDGRIDGADSGCSGDPFDGTEGNGTQTFGFLNQVILGNSYINGVPYINNNPGANPWCNLALDAGTTTPWALDCLEANNIVNPIEQITVYLGGVNELGLSVEKIMQIY